MEDKKELLSTLNNISIMNRIYDYLEGVEGLEGIQFEKQEEKTPSIAMACGVGEKYDFDIVGGHYVRAPFSIFYKAKDVDTSSRIDAMNKMIAIAQVLENTNDYPTMDKGQESISFELINAPTPLEQGKGYTIHGMEIQFLYYQN